MPIATHAEYFAGVPLEARSRLESIQAKVEALLPDATRCIGYGMPAFRRGRIFFYVAAVRKHIGIDPPLTGDAALIRELAPYRGEKGNLSFALKEPLPLELIGRVAVALHEQYGRTP